MATVYLILALIIAAVAVVFAVQNAMTVTITFMAWKVTGSLSLVLLATLIIGTVVGLLVLAPSAIRNTLAASGHRKRIGLLEKELDDHRQRLADLQRPKSEPLPPSPAPTQLPSSPAPTPPTESDQPEQ